MKRLKVTLTAVVNSDENATACEHLATQLLRTAHEMRTKPHRPYFPLESDQPVRQLDISFEEIPEVERISGRSGE